MTEPCAERLKDMMKAPKVAALAVTVCADQVLLVRRKNEPDAGLWGFPGGHVDLGETGLFAAARELREETSVIGRPLQYLTNLDVIVRDEHGSIKFHFLLAVVLCEYISGEPKADDDVSEAAWVAVDDVLFGKLRCSEHVGDVIRLATGSKL